MKTQKQTRRIKPVEIDEDLLADLKVMKAQMRFKSISQTILYLFKNQKGGKT
jgi:hypothetical protein